MFKISLKSKMMLPLSVLLGILAGYSHLSGLIITAEVISSIFINLLKLMSLPIIFLSIINTALKFETMDTLKLLGGRVLKYTLITTLIAATVALVIFTIVAPISASIPETAHQALDAKHTYLESLTNIIPSNILQPFIEGNVISVLILAVIFGFGMMAVSSEKRKPLKQFFDSLYSVVIKIVSGIIKWLPIGIFAFVTIFVSEMSKLNEIENLLVYLGCILLANLIQAIIVLPILLKTKNISPTKLFKQMMPALSVAFFSKSSSAALPIALKCAKEKANMSSEVSDFSLPLCTTINMNACAAFILITVLFVSTSHGLTFNPLELFAWIFIATIAAIGNASVPMGCYFLATSLLAALGVPLQMMAIILPVYSLIDMLESAINVWSDSCVTAIVDKETSPERLLEVARA